MPDQVGFCRSAKPRAYQFSLHQLAANTHALLTKLGVEHPIVMGHSMGGMLAIRYALMYPARHRRAGAGQPDRARGLEGEGRAAGDRRRALCQGAQDVGGEHPQYQQTVYYQGKWQPAYDRWVNMLASMYTGKDGDLVAWDQALTTDMLLSQPVIYEIDQIKVPTLLLIGMKDTTALGKDRAPPEAAKALGNYAALAPAVTARIKGATLVTFDDLGHAPQVEDRDRFDAALLKALDVLLPAKP